MWSHIVYDSKYMFFFLGEYSFEVSIVVGGRIAKALESVPYDWTYKSV